MKKLVVILTMILAQAVAFAASPQPTPVNVHIQRSPMNLDGRWKLVSCLARGVNGVDDDIVKKEIGEVASIRSDVLQVKLLRAFFKCKISEPPIFIKKKDCPLFDPGDPGALQLTDFDLSDYVFVFKTEEIEENNSFSEIVVDSGGDKMILGYEGGQFLFVRQKKKGKSNL